VRGNTGEDKANMLESGCGRGPQARHWDHGSDLGRTQALSVGKHEAIPGPAFDYRGCCDLRWENYAEDWFRVACEM